jgi:outer membrane protein OmpA-like peptidoglycan-associated protein
MSLRTRLNVTSLLLTSTALLTAGAMPSATHAATLSEPFVIAQAPAPDDRKPPAPGAQPPAKPQPPAPPRAQPPAPSRPAPTAQPQQPPGGAPPRATEERRPAPAAQQERREERGNERRQGQPPAPSTAQQPNRQPPAATQERREESRDDRRRPAPATAQPPGTPPAPSTAQQPNRQPPPAAQDRREERRDDRRRPAPATAQPSTTPPPAQPNVPPTVQERRQPGAPPTAQQPQPQNVPATAQPQQRPVPPATAQQPNAQPAPAVQNANPAAVAPPTQARSANEFIRRDGQGPGRRMDQVRQERQESREGNRTFIREGDRTIVREDNRVIIRHNESNRFAIDARNVRTERRGANTETIIERGNGMRIITVTDPEGRLLRRMRRGPDGRDVIIIDNSYAGRGADMYLQLPPPVIRIPRERYILDAERARPEEIYQVFEEPPVEIIDQPYTLDQIRYSAPLRDRMPRVDLDVTFETGSWQLSPDQVERLAAVAEGLNRAIQRNPREVFLVEGHTDAVGNDVDNLSLSDRRAESVAVALTEQFQVPAENLVTQGYGEQYLKVPTQGPERLNRRVAVRRITPLLDQQAQNAPPPR